jgi:hypothetical protein
MGKFLTGLSPIFDGKNHGFRLRFSLKPIQWYYHNRFLKFSDNSRTALGEWMRYAAPELRQAHGGTGAMGDRLKQCEGHLNGKVWVEASIYE